MDDEDYEFAYDSTFETNFKTSDPKKPEKESAGNPINLINSDLKKNQNVS